MTNRPVRTFNPQSGRAVMLAVDTAISRVHEGLERIDLAIVTHYSDAQHPAQRESRLILEAAGPSEMKLAFEHRG